jgi:uncharacterized RDD family membrane protein YckC
LSTKDFEPDWYPEEADEDLTPTGPGGGHSRYFSNLDEDDYGSPRGYFGDIRTANPLQRIGSLFIDFVVSVFVPAGVADLLGFSGNTLVIVMVVFVALNSVVFAQETGQTIGKRLVGTQAVRGIVSQRGRQSLVNRGPAMNMVRAACHVFDLLLWFISIPLILVSRHHRSIGDFLTKTMVISPDVIEPLQAPPRGAKTLTR